MKPSTIRIPQGIADYVKDRFREEFLFDVKSVVNVDGDTFYNVQVTKDGYIHALRFNANGQLVKEEADFAFPEDVYELRGIDSDRE